jgi:hypothetical protein
MAAFQFYLQSRKPRKVGWVGDDSHVVFGKKEITSRHHFHFLQVIEELCQEHSTRVVHRDNPHL